MLLHFYITSPDFYEFTDLLLPWLWATLDPNISLIISYNLFPQQSKLSPLPFILVHLLSPILPILSFL